MPSAFLFDIGNVIISFDFGIAARRLAPHCSIAADEALERVVSLHPELETGRLSPDEFIREATDRVGYRGTAEEFRRAFEDIFDLNESIARFIEQVKGTGAALHLLSNTNGIHVPFFESTYPVFARFDGRIYSHEVGVMKPDPEIYRIAIETLDLDPAETVYIDDLPANCEAGRDAGLISLPYRRDEHDRFLESVSAYL